MMMRQHHTNRQWNSTCKWRPGGNVPSAQIQVTKANDHLSVLHQISSRSKSSSSALQNRTIAGIGKQTTLQRRNSTCLMQYQLQQMVQTKANRKIICSAEGEESHCGKKETHREGGGTGENAHFLSFCFLMWEPNRQHLALWSSNHQSYW